MSDSTKTQPHGPPRKLVLVGAGHAHVEVLRSFAMRPPANATITLISPDSYATYSGMVPGYLAGQYDLREAQIDARALAARARANFLPARVVGVDASNKTLRLENYPDQFYDVVSFDIGSQPAHRDRIRDHPNTVLVKPIEIAARDVGGSLALPPPSGGRAVVVVGAGPGGVEVAFAIATRLREEGGGTVTVCDRSTLPVRERGERAARVVERAFTDRGIRFLREVEVNTVDRDGVTLSDGAQLPADLVVWATGAAAPDLFESSGLEVDARRFLSVDDHLRSVSDKAIFGAGDCVTPRSIPTLPKAGVFAVRQGPVLTNNLRSALGEGRPRRFKPQRRFLSLLNTADGKAILSYGTFALRSRAGWWLKDFIDRRFMARYARPALAPPDSSMGEMQPCGGCAAKVGADVLERVLAKLEIPPAPHVTVGLAQADDAAAFRNPSDGPDEPQLSVVTTDLFPPFADDLHLVGQVAAVSAASDLFAMGADGAAALAIIAVPEQDPRTQESSLEALLRGALVSLKAMGIPLVGGHTIATDTTLIGFSMHGFAAEDNILKKSDARTDDVLILSKPLGTGVLLAAARAGHADSDWVEACHAAMLRSNAPVMRLLLGHGARACTDVTGFGLSGHLADLARQSGVTAAIELDSIPALPGAVDLLEHGWRSSFHASNERAGGDPRNPLLIDPQTSGGLLATLPRERLANFQSACEEAGEAVWVIGKMVEKADGPIRIS